MTDQPPVSLVRKDGSVSSPTAPPFEPGNTAAMRHGGYSKRAIEAKASEVHDELLRFAPWLDQPHFQPAVARYLAAAAREQLIDAHIQRVCAEQGAHKVPVRLWESATSVSRLAARLGSDLGLDPQGHAKIAILQGAAVSAEASVADLAERGRALREQATRVVADVIEGHAEEQR